MNSGTRGFYVLALWLDRPRRMAVGRLGWVDFPAGWYLYAGSALGPGGLPARVGRHHRRLTDGKKAHWHVDHLRELAAWGGAWGQPAAPEPERRYPRMVRRRDSAGRQECAWARTLGGLPSAREVARGFGASDCACATHLFQVPVLPDDDWFEAVLGAERIVVGVEDELDALIDRLLTGDDDGREEAALGLRLHGRRAVERLGAILSCGEAAAGSRWWAARALAAVGHPAAIEPLVAALSDEEADVRACAALALGRLGDPLRALPSAPRPSDSFGAGRTGGTAGPSAGAEAAPFLARRLGDESGFVASVAADALTMLGEPAVEALAGMLDAESVRVRLLAVRALGRIGSERAIGALCGRLEDSSYLVRYHAQEALEALGVGMVYLSP